ncbi:hypothetical protein HDU93_001312 [Gonapodya sp. JEL0774]|nr:hypothetical protein HDU93_001312 [Gonapodya sp. JEL0774]
MPLVTPPDFERVYAEIRRQGSMPDAHPVLVFVSNDVDAVCAGKIIISLLSADNIRHSLVPIGSYTDLGKANDERITGREDLRSLILVNCGALVEAADFFNLAHPDARIYIVDTHRPCNLKNLWGQENVIVFVEEEFETPEMVEVRDAYMQLEYAPDLESDAGSDDDDRPRDQDPDRDGDEGHDDEGNEDDEARRALEDDDANGEGVNGRLRQLEGDDDWGDEDKENRANDEEGGGSPSRKRRHPPSESPPKRVRTTPPPLSTHASRTARRRENARLREILASYYAAGTWHAGSVAALWCDMVWKVGRGGNEELWLALIGLTHLLHHHRVTPRVYENAITTKWTGLAAPLNTALATDTRAGLFPSEEFRFCLWRHWNVYDGMAHSEYVAVKLGLWKEKGRRKMKQMFAKTGIPNSEAREPSSSMPSSLKKRLTTTLPVTAREFNMDDLQYPSFARRYGTRGHQATVSAADAAMALDALLDGGAGWVRHNERGEVVVEERVQSGIVEDEERSAARGEAKSWRDVEVQTVGVGTGRDTGSVGLVRVDAMRAGKSGEGEHDQANEWMTHFFTAFDALSNIDILRQGILIARHLQTATVRAATTLLDKNAFRSLNTFRLAVVGQSQLASGALSGTTVRGSGRIGPADSALFGRNASWLENLGNMVFMAIKEWSQQKKDSNFVIAAFKAESDTYLVCGLPRKGKNPFALAFQEAASKARVNYKQDLFESHVIEVNKADFSRLVEYLQRMSRSD